MHMPPPIHGAAMIGQYIHNSKLINNSFKCSYINPSASNSIADVGVISVGKIIFALKNLFCIIRTIRREKPDLCYYTPTSDGWGIYRDAVTILILKALKQKIVLHLHNKGVKEYNEKHKFSDLIYKLIFKKTKVIQLSNLLYYDIEKFCNPKDVYFCPNGIPSTLSNTQYLNCTEYRKNIFPITFLFLSNMLTTKGVWTLVDACNILKHKCKKFKCIFIGKWANISEKEFNNKINEYELANYVTALGAKYGKEKYEHFYKSHVFILPSFGECFPLVVLEAMEYGLPCICSSVGGIPQIIHNGENGYLIEPQNPQMLAEKMIHFIDNPQIIESMGHNSRESFIRQYTLSSFENRIRDIFIEITN